ncbi:pantothenate synthetase [Humitalea rosea]|uniref:Pantothenate synthetase n=1 Tax=Humitalea rosea TaxID=990373 RepID=A0A2W7I265_9PROT|nr:pantoate--beta-alanine ligase [Humitalea rosea]PZW40834.1 pantothenate synthetase [Humitalea rosea]
MTLPIARDVATLRATIAGWRDAGQSVALVPTMGALHAGHLALLARGRELADRVVTSIFVNPTQFAPTEDLARYPRDEAGDVAALVAAGCDLLYAPGPEAIYPPGFCTAILPGGPALGLEAAFRPQMYGGVALVCTKLFTQCGPDLAIFGEKDWQQVQVVRRVVADLDLPLRIMTVATVREADGLAMSSRNRFLDARARAIAPALYRVLSGIAEGRAPVRAEAELLEAGFDSVDYVALRRRDLSPGGEVVLGAARLGAVRLIDAVPVSAGERG